MAPHDELKHGATRYVLGDPGRSYSAYADRWADKLGVKDLPAGRCEVTWLDCLSGRLAEEQHVLPRAGDHGFDKPPAFGPECVAWIRFPDLKASLPARVAPATTELASPDNHPPAVEDQRWQTSPGATLYIQLKFADDDGPGPYSYTIVGPPVHGTLSGDNEAQPQLYPDVGVGAGRLGPLGRRVRCRGASPLRTHRARPCAGWQAEV